MPVAKILLYYAFTPLADPEAVRLWQRDLAESLGIPALAGPFLLATVAYGLAAVVLFVFLRPDPFLVARQLVAPAVPADATHAPYDEAPREEPAGGRYLAANPNTDRQAFITETRGAAEARVKAILIDKKAPVEPLFAEVVACDQRYGLPPPPQ